MKILVTGSCGFIGSSLCPALLNRGDEVVGLDNHNDYYSTQLKEDRLLRHLNHPHYEHVRADISNNDQLADVFKKNHFDRVVNLAAQAGVRFSLENPRAYMESNLVGFLNILENCRQHHIKHLVYASSSSVYGANTRMPFSESDSVNHPVSFYAASKKSNELMAHSYSYLFDLPTTGLRFFTVYGPWDRPDMAAQKFARAIQENQVIKLNNHGNHKRDFTYIDDVIDGIMGVLDTPPSKSDDWNSQHPDASFSAAPWRIFNIGSGNPIPLISYLGVIEKYMNKKANIEMLPLQLGDVIDTFADITRIRNLTNYKPRTTVDQGLKNFVDWYLDYYRR